MVESADAAAEIVAEIVVSELRVALLKQVSLPPTLGPIAGPTPVDVVDTLRRITDGAMLRGNIKLLQEMSPIV